MLNTQIEFNSSKQEVELYFTFLNRIDDGYTLLKSPKDSFEYTIDNELITILKANAFLILYNLVEATIRNGLWEVISVIAKKKIIYKDLLSTFKKDLSGCSNN